MKNLKSKMLALVMAAALASSLSIYSARAEDAPADKPKGPPHGHHGGGHFEHWKKMADELNLTAEQRDKIKEILKEKFKETKEEIEAVLTPEQKVKLEEKKAEWKAKRKNKGPKADKPAA